MTFSNHPRGSIVVKTAIHFRRLHRQITRLNKTIISLYHLTKPFHPTILGFFAILGLYEGLQAADSLFPSLIVSFALRQATLAHWIGLFVAILVMSAVHIWLDNKLDWVIIMNLSNPVYIHLKEIAFSKLLNLHMAWHQATNSGAEVGKVQRGVDKTQEIFSLCLWEFVPTLVQSLIDAVILLVRSPFVLINMILSLVIFMYLSLSNFVKRTWPRRKRHDDYEDEWILFNQSTESAAVETIKSYGQVDHYVDRLRTILYDIKHQAGIESQIGIYGYNRPRIAIIKASRTLNWVIWALQMQSGTLTIPEFIFLQTRAEKIFHSYWRFARLFEQFQEAVESVDRLMRVLATTPQIDSSLGEQFQDVTPTISIEDLQFTYPSSNSKNNGGLHGINLNIAAGEVVGVVGTSGAGKTTLRRLITGLWLANAGQILIGGHTINEWNPNALLSQFAYVPQGHDVVLWDFLTMGENISLSRPTATQEEIETAAHLAGIHDYIVSLKGGYSSKVGERGVHLSGGQKQRLALARAILADRPFFILDEATSSVDKITEHEIQKNLKSGLLAGKTVIVIAHNLSTVWDIADRIIVMQHGRIIEQGSHEELLTQKGVYAQMAALQGGSH